MRGKKRLKEKIFFSAENAWKWGERGKAPRQSQEVSGSKAAIRGKNNNIDKEGEKWGQPQSLDLFANFVLLYKN